MRRPPPTSTLFPYTTLFRSNSGDTIILNMRSSPACCHPSNTEGMFMPVRVASNPALDGSPPWVAVSRAMYRPCALHCPAFLFRSEEHTSELQSHSDLVCRLL